MADGTKIHPSAQRFGRELARARRLAGMTQLRLSRAVDTSKSHISNLERGYRNPSLSLLPRLDEQLRTEGRLSQLWDELSGDGRPAWLDEIASAIQAADAVYEYQVLAFPSYLQTPGYTRALIKYGAPWSSPDEVTAVVEERTARAKDLAAAITPKLWLVIDQSLLGRRYGGQDATREQLHYVADLVEQERLTLQVVPAASPRHPGNSGAFRILTAHRFPDIVYVESAREGQMVTTPTEVAWHRMVFAALQGEATTPHAALTALREEIEKVDNEHE